MGIGLTPSRLKFSRFFTGVSLAQHRQKFVVHSSPNPSFRWLRSRRARLRWNWCSGRAWNGLTTRRPTSSRLQDPTGPQPAGSGGMPRLLWVKSVGMPASERAGFEARVESEVAVGFPGGAHDPTVSRCRLGGGGGALEDSGRCSRRSVSRKGISGPCRPWPRTTVTKPS